MVNRRAIGMKLRELRGDTRREVVAAACNVSAQAIALYENAGRIPRDDIKIKLAKFYGVSVQSIFYPE